MTDRPAANTTAPIKLSAETARICKEASARAAVALVENGMKLGLGTGSTAHIMVEILAERVRAEGLELRCAATSYATSELARSLGLRVEDLDEIGWLDMTIDGADEVDPDLNLIKGGGAAHLREKIVATASDRMVVIADPAKVVDTLGAFKLPVEIIPFAWRTTRERIVRALSEMAIDPCPVELRLRDGQPVQTDQGNYVLDLALGRIDDPMALADTLKDLPGVVEHGLFLGVCDLALIGQPDGSVVELTHPYDDAASDPIFGEDGGA